MAAKRLAREMEKTREKFDVECVNDNIMKWHVALPGPDHSSYFGGTFLVELTFPSDYPFRSPEAIFQTKIYHPNINHKGDVCLGTIKDGWTPAYTPLMIVECILELLSTPNPDDPLVPEIASLFRRDPASFRNKAEEWTHQYAM